MFGVQSRQSSAPVAGLHNKDCNRTSEHGTKQVRLVLVLGFGWPLHQLCETLPDGSSRSRSRAP